MLVPEPAQSLTPELLTVLDEAAAGNVWAESAREPVSWMVGGRFDARPCVPEVQSLIDAGLLVWDEYGTARGSWRFAVPTGTGRALLGSLNSAPGGRE